MGVPPLKTFVSFSSNDDIFVSKLLARLRAQPLNVWLYSMEGEEIPGSANLAVYLQERVAQSTLFIPLVSAASLESRYTTIEVKAALACHQAWGLPIVPLVDVAVKDKPWPDYYEPLRSFRYFEVDFKHHAHWEEAVRRICECDACKAVGVKYLPFNPEDVRLPFMDRFHREIESFHREIKNRPPRDKERAYALHERLLRTVNTFAAAFEEQDYPGALRATEYFLALCEYEYDGEPFYYPYIVKAVCLIALGRLAEAAELLNQLQRRKPPDAEANENSVLGALGYVKQALGQYGEAADYYRESLKRDPSDAAAATGVVVNEVLSGRRKDLEEAIKVIQKGTFLTEQDRLNARAVDAMGLAQMGRSREAAEILLELKRLGQATPDTLINFAKVLFDLRQTTAAEEVMEELVAQFPAEIEVRRQAARLYIDCGPLQQAVPHLEALVSLQPKDLDVLFELLNVLVRTGERQQAKRRADELLAILPSAPDHFYYTGFANWLLGKADRAYYDFERSGHGPEEYYDRLPQVVPLGT